MSKKLNLKNITMLIGEQIYKARIALKLSQEELAEAANLSRVSISQIENGNKSAKISTYYRIASALNIALYELFCWDNDNQETLDRLLCLLSDCSSDEIIAYTEILRTVKLQSNYFRN